MAKVNMKTLQALQAALVTFESAQANGKLQAEHVKTAREALDNTAGSIKDAGALAEAFSTILAAELAGMNKAQIQTRKRSMTRCFHRTHESLTLTLNTTKGGDVSHIIKAAPTQADVEKNKYKKAAILLADTFPTLAKLPEQVGTLMAEAEKAAQVAEDQKVKLAESFKARAEAEQVELAEKWLADKGMEVNDNNVNIARLAMAGIN